MSAFTGVTPAPARRVLRSVIASKHRAHRDRTNPFYLPIQPQRPRTAIQARLERLEAEHRATTDPAVRR